VECKKTHLTQFCHLNSDIKIVKQQFNKNNHISASAIKVLLLNGFIEEATGSVFDAPLDMV
jgi:phage-related minor tail protein